MGSSDRLREGQIRRTRWPRHEPGPSPRSGSWRRWPRHRMCSPWPRHSGGSGPISPRNSPSTCSPPPMRRGIAISGCRQPDGWCMPGRRPEMVGRRPRSALEQIRRWGASALAVPAAHRLRVELALVALGTGQTDRARALLAPVVVAETTPLLRADARTALARCAVEDAPTEVASELRNARAAWSEVDRLRRQSRASPRSTWSRRRRIAEAVGPTPAQPRRAPGSPG